MNIDEQADKWLKDGLEKTRRELGLFDALDEHFVKLEKIREQDTTLLDVSHLANVVDGIEEALYGVTATLMKMIEAHQFYINEMARAMQKYVESQHNG